MLQHIVANNGKTIPQLFRGAITSSLFLPSQYNYNDRIPEVSDLLSPYFCRRSVLICSVVVQRSCRTDKVRWLVTISNTCIDLIPSPSCSAATDALACLRTVDATALEMANIAINAAGFYGTWLLVPVIDGEFITQRPSLSLSQGKLNGVYFPLGP